MLGYSTQTIIFTLMGCLVTEQRKIILQANPLIIVLKEKLHTQAGRIGRAQGCGWVWSATFTVTTAWLLDCYAKTNDSIASLLPELRHCQGTL